MALGVAVLGPSLDLRIYGKDLSYTTDFSSGSTLAETFVVNRLFDFQVQGLTMVLVGIMRCREQC